MILIPYSRDFYYYTIYTIFIYLHNKTRKLLYGDNWVTLKVSKCVPKKFCIFNSNKWLVVLELSEKVQVWQKKQYIHYGMYCVPQCQHPKLLLSSVYCFGLDVPFYYNFLSQRLMLLPWTKINWRSEIKLPEECSCFFGSFSFSISIKFQPNLCTLKHFFFLISTSFTKATIGICCLFFILAQAPIQQHRGMHHLFQSPGLSVIVYSAALCILLYLPTHLPVPKLTFCLSLRTLVALPFSKVRVF